MACHDDSVMNAIMVITTFRVRRKSVCLCVSLSAAACPHYHTNPEVTWGMVGGAL